MFARNAAPLQLLNGNFCLRTGVTPPVRGFHQLARLICREDTILSIILLACRQVKLERVQKVSLR
jgi:hypothetical protein